MFRLARSLFPSHLFFLPIASSRGFRSFRESMRRTIDRGTPRKIPPRLTPHVTSTAQRILTDIFLLAVVPVGDDRHRARHNGHLRSIFTRSPNAGNTSPQTPRAVYTRDTLDAEFALQRTGMRPFVFVRKRYLRTHNELNIYYKLLHFLICSLECFPFSVQYCTFNIKMLKIQFAVK